MRRLPPGSRIPPLAPPHRRDRPRAAACPALAPGALLLAAALLLGACGEAGSYELHWSLGCPGTDPSACALRTVQECSQVGVDSMVVYALRGDQQEARSIFPCFTEGEGGVGRGPGLDPGTLTLRVSALSPGGQTLSGPVEAQVAVAESGLVEVWVDVPPPPACNDGVDNDGDGHVDLNDPACADLQDTDEAS